MCPSSVIDGRILKSIFSKHKKQTIILTMGSQSAKVKRIHSFIYHAHHLNFSCIFVCSSFIMLIAFVLALFDLSFRMVSRVLLPLHLNDYIRVNQRKLHSKDSTVVALVIISDSDYYYFYDLYCLTSYVFTLKSEKLIAISGQPNFLKADESQKFEDPRNLQDF